MEFDSFDDKDLDDLENSLYSVIGEYDYSDLDNVDTVWEPFNSKVINLFKLEDMEDSETEEIFDCLKVELKKNEKLNLVLEAIEEKILPSLEYIKSLSDFSSSSEITDEDRDAISEHLPTLEEGVINLINSLRDQE